MGKYTGLEQFLKKQPGSSVTLSFTDVERTISPEILPRSARKDKSGLYSLRWWDNVPGSAETDAWLNAGFQVVMLDIENEKVKFMRKK